MWFFQPYSLKSSFLTYIWTIEICFNFWNAYINCVNFPLQAVDIKLLGSLNRDDLKKICGDNFPEWISFPAFEQVCHFPSYAFMRVIHFPDYFKCLGYLNMSFFSLSFFFLIINNEAWYPKIWNMIFFLLLFSHKCYGMVCCNF